MGKYQSKRFPDIVAGNCDYMQKDKLKMMKMPMPVYAFDDDLPTKCQKAKQQKNGIPTTLLILVFLRRQFQAK